jgi:hypothetical protein
MSLRFMGDWSPWLGAPVALALAAFAWWLYRRESRVQAGRLRWVLPLCRTLVVFMAVLMLTGPVLHHRKVVGERVRVLVFVDASESMKLTDETMEASRKLLAVRRLGWLPEDAVDAKLAEAADALVRARRAGGGDASEPAGWRETSQGFAREVEAALALLSRVKAETGGVSVERRGVALREAWTGVPGGAVSDLTRNPKFGGPPDRVGAVELFEAPADWADAYGTRLRGFVHPPATGNYTFWVSGDDQAELWVSPDGDPARKQAVARVAVSSPPRGWDAVAGQKSAPIRLQAGQKAYVEALHKESTGGDHVAVGWQLPDGTMERPIPGTRLSAPAEGGPPAASVDAMVARYKEELLAPAQALAAARGGDAAKNASALAALVQAAGRWERELRQAFAAYANRRAASPDAAVTAALQKFDQLPRWKRVEELLVGGQKTLLEKLSEKHHVELLALAGREAQPLWGSERPTDEEGQRFPRSLPEPAAKTTDLADGVSVRVGAKQEERVAVVLVSDGQHNDGASPLQMAKVRGSQKIPVHTVSIGSAALPEDLAVLKVKTPAQVFFKDRVKGELVLKDDMPPGRPFTAKIECAGQLVWEKRLTTDQSHLRSIPFDFPVQALVEKLAQAREKGVEVLNQPLAFQASVTGVDGEREKRNNESGFNLHAIMQRRRVLLLDGRPRWELRYLRNLFERDEQWDVNALLADRGTDATAWPRGAGAGKFPGDRESLFAYDLVVFGEVPRQFLKMEELEWLKEFVEKRGGGLLVVDGRRGHVSNYADSPMGALLPVDWKAEGGRPTGLRLTPAGQRWAPLALASEPEKNAELWASLPAPHWTAPARALPSAEVLLEAAIGERRLPALVLRRFGAGKVLYSGFDESWRWRYEVSDLHQTRYWNQVVRDIMEPPYAVRDARLSLDAGAPVYASGESATIRARLRDAQGRPLAKADAEAWIYRDGRKVASVKLEADENRGGAFHGSTGPLAPGKYEVRVRAEGAPEPDARVRTEFVVRPPEAGELAVLHAQEDLLRQIASQSAGGEFFREEDAGDLVSRLEPLSKERVFESDTALWQSWWWFLPIVALLTLEWVTRKWAGML